MCIYMSLLKKGRKKKKKRNDHMAQRDMTTEKKTKL